MSAPYKTILCIDFETRWSKADYTLSKMTTEEYIRDKRFKVFGACIREMGDDRAPQWYRGNELPRILGTYDWTKTAVLAHNAQFDVSILSWTYEVRPCFIFDTLSMARALRGVEVGNSLARLAADFGLPEKGRAVHSTDGLAELPLEIEKELAAYCQHDVVLCEEIFRRLIVGYPAKELRLIDMTLKMYTNAVLQLDKLMLANALEDEKETREALLARLQVTDAMLASNTQFAELLERVGVNPPTKKKKPTQKTPNPIGLNFAFAKNDAMFQAMLNGDNEDVAALCEARLKVKSTTERTRAQRFLDISHRGTLPVPLSYYGALSGRWTASKGSAINMQNLKRGSFLREAIMAPEGYQLVVGDLSQIEPRVLAWLSDYTDMLSIFSAGGDPYAAFGAQMFNIPGMTKESHPVHRQSAKSALLGAGYGLGWASFAGQLLVGFLGAPPLRYTKSDAKQLGATTVHVDKFIDWEPNIEKMMEIPHICSDKELLTHCIAAKRIIDIYRNTAHPVVSFWNMCERLIKTALYEGKPHTHKCLTFSKGEILLPNGMRLLYPNLHQEKNLETKKMEWVYGEEGKRTKLYAGKITNNCLAEGTLVLTDSGWVAIEHVTKEHLVHDGVEFVRHAGNVFNGLQTCVTLDGVTLTPEHKVLTNAGWKEASQVQEPYRPDLRHVDGASARLVYREGVAVAVPMPVWETLCEVGRGRDQREDAGRNPELRVRYENSDWQKEQHARYEYAPSVHRMAQYGEQVHKACGASIQKLRRAWDSSVRQVVAGLQVFLERHGAYVHAGERAGPQGQQRPVLSRELSLDFAPHQYDEQTQYRAQGRRNGVEQEFGDTGNNVVLQVGARMASSAPDAQAGCKKPVYDIMDAGPRSRFVVMGTEGPFIVHNCVQAVARIVMTDGMLRVSNKYPVVGTVHDEQIVLVPDSEVAVAKTWVLAQMTMEPKYMPGIPLDADGGAHRRYGLAKG